AWLVAVLLNLHPDLTAGLFAGALTSTPALAAAVERLPPDSQVAVGYGVAYPFGVLGVIIFAELAPRLLIGKWTSSQGDAEQSVEPARIARQLVRIQNPRVVQKRLREVRVLKNSNCQVSRVVKDGRLTPIPADFQLQIGDEVLIIGAKANLEEVVEVLGEGISFDGYVLDVERQRRRVIVTSKAITGKSLEELHLLSKFGVTISRIQRHDVEFVPRASDRIQLGDAVTAVGEVEGLERFVAFAGHRERTFDETDLISLSVGLILGILLGSVEFQFDGNSLSLGMAGGPLLVGLLFGHLGNFGFLVGHMPRAARLLLSEVGLSLFLMQAGSQAGKSFLSTISDHGLLLCVGAMMIVVVPLIVGIVAGRYLFRMDILELCGGVCGAMTSTPGLGAISAKVDSGVPTASYSAVYPLALMIVTILTPILLSLLQ
ncbi:MAG: hypothetical protein KDA80_02130, partial [Planctomycetaceae bacterium]|nr:hypothetical protein [Planctomycetaceae bacterium]